MEKSHPSFPTQTTTPHMLELAVLNMALLLSVPYSCLVEGTVSLGTKDKDPGSNLPH